MELKGGGGLIDRCARLLLEMNAGPKFCNCMVNVKPDILVELGQINHEPLALVAVMLITRKFCIFRFSVSEQSFLKTKPGASDCSTI